MVAFDWALSCVVMGKALFKLTLNLSTAGLPVLGSHGSCNSPASFYSAFGDATQQPFHKCDGHWLSLFNDPQNHWAVCSCDLCSCHSQGMFHRSEAQINDSLDKPSLPPGTRPGALCRWGWQVCWGQMKRRSKVRALILDWIPPAPKSLCYTFYPPNHLR